MYSNNSDSNKFATSTIVKIILIILLAVQVRNDALGKSPMEARRISVDKNPVLISDSLKKIDSKLVLNSSLDRLSENIYFSAINNALYLKKLFQVNIRNTKFSEILALNEFYKGNYTQAEKILSMVFDTTTDSLQKAKTCLNLIKINYLNSQLSEAIKYLKIAKYKLSKFYTYPEKYQLVFTEARIALTQGMTAKAEHLIIATALPMSNKTKGRYNEFNCYLFLGKIYLKARQFTQAKWFFIQANSIAVNKNYTDGKIESSLLLAKTKITVGDKFVALQDLARARSLIDEQHRIYLADLKHLNKLAKQ